MGTKLGDRLKADALINQFQLEYAQQWVERSGGTLIDAVIELRLVNEASLLRYLATVEKTRYVSSEKLSKLRVPSSALVAVAPQTARQFTICPITRDAASHVLTVVASPPFPEEAIAEIAAGNPGEKVQVFVALPSAVQAAIKRHFDNDIDSFREIEPRLNEDIAAFLRSYAAGSEEADGSFVAASAQASLSAEITQPPPSDPALTQLAGIPPEPPPAAGALALPALPPVGFTSAAAARVTAPPSPPREVPPAVRPPTGERSLSGVRGAISAAAMAADGLDVLALLDVMTGTVEVKRTSLRGHSSTVARLATHVAERLGLGEEETRHVLYAAYLHDLGKKDDAHLTLLSIDNSEDLASLAREQYAIPSRLVSAVRFPEPAHQILNHLYEAYDGSGLPEGLAGQAIPAGARIIAVIDAYEDLTDNPENYMGGAQEMTAALEVLRMHGDLLFDPRIIEAVAQILMTEGLRKKLLAASPWVLVVDRKADDTSVLEFKLTQKGYNVVVCRDTAAAEKHLANQDFDLFISEVDTTPKDGFAFMRELRETTKYAQTPFIFFSKVADSSAVQRGFDLGATDWITKPFSADVFAAKIKRYLDERPRETGPRKDRGVAGSLTEMALPDILQLLSQGRKSGQLIVKSHGREGEIYLDQGLVVDAIAGGMRGEEAFYLMLTWEEGDFMLDPEFLMMGGTISKRTEGLIMEGLRRLDESKR